MYTQCPGCLSLYALSMEALIEGRGRACCGSCRTEFDVLASLSAHLPQPPDTMLTRHLPGDVPTLSHLAGKPKSSQRDLFTVVPVAESDPLESEQAAPVFAAKRIKRTPLRGSGRLWRRANLLLALALMAQLAFATRHHWLASPQVRPYLDAACERLGCRLPARRDVTQIALVARDVRPHPSEAGALVISATMLNRANFGQPYPTLEITLSNLDEQRIAMRRLAPQDYLNDARALSRGLPPGATATIDLEVFDLGKQAVAFEFRFL